MSSTGSPSVIAYQGEPGSNSDAACRQVFPELDTLPCPTFEDAFGVIEEGAADLAMIPIENSIAGRVADIHHLLPESGLHIIGEHFMPIHFALLAVPGASEADITTVRSHTHALGQCRKLIREHGWRSVVADDTA
ncbi:MAG: prephenate dehydratase, partial [Actinomycetales bacterium mxb001]